MQVLFEDFDLDYQLQRSLAKADFGMANAGECLRIASQIEDGNADAWYPAFSAFADGLRERADIAARAGRRVSARSQYLRCCEYYRNSFFFIRGDLDDDRVHASLRSSRDCYRVAAELHDHRLLPVEISDACIGYLGLPDGEGPFPLLLAPGGYDSTAEELHPTLAAGVARGYSVLIFDGPGQGTTLYERRVPMRPDWETVIPVVFDAMAERPQIDPERVALLGRSFGGYLCPRGAAGEHRLAALVVDPGQFDLGAGLRERLPRALFDRLEEDSDQARAAFQGLLTSEAGRRLFEPRMTAHGTDSVQKYCRMMLAYTNEGHAGSIRCPTLVCDNETDAISASQGRLLYEHLKCPKEFTRFTAAEGAGGHCEGMGAIVFYERVFDWLDSRLLSSA